MKPLEKLRIERFCSFVYWMVTRNGDENEIAKLRAKLWMPPPGEIEAEEREASLNDERSPWSPENETKALAAFKSQMSGEVKGPVSIR